MQRICVPFTNPFERITVESRKQKEEIFWSDIYMKNERCNCGPQSFLD